MKKRIIFIYNMCLSICLRLFQHNWWRFCWWNLLMLYKDLDWRRLLSRLLNVTSHHTVKVQSLNLEWLTRSFKLLCLNRLVLTSYDILRSSWVINLLFWAWWKELIICIFLFLWFSFELFIWLDFRLCRDLFFFPFVYLKTFLWPFWGSDNLSYICLYHKLSFLSLKKRGCMF